MVPWTKKVINKYQIPLIGLIHFDEKKIDEILRAGFDDFFFLPLTFTKVKHMIMELKLIV